MHKRIILTALTGSSLFVANAAYAQWANPTPGAQHVLSSSAQFAAAGSLTLAERQALWSGNKAEYRRRLARDGQASADRWLNEQARPDKPKAQPKTTKRTGKKDCKKVRWVNRATPGFGGAPMTMRRVAVCAD